MRFRSLEPGPTGCSLQRDNLERFSLYPASEVAAIENAGRGNRMRIWHGAAIALAGWYLMVPPWSGPNQFDDAAPLKRWKQVGAYDSAGACERDKAHSVDFLSKDKALDTKTARFNAAIYASGLCVDSNDPRLKP
jgi:hypothetical protein